MLKIRTMVMDAEEKLKAEKGLYELYIKNNFKLDPDLDVRILSTGKILRILSLDELPQLWHVLIGDMSLVGPRPIVPEELKNYHPSEDLFLSVKPGITGIWQTSGRSNVGYPLRKEMDLQYIREINLLLDLKILLKTLVVVLKADGAN